MKKAAFRDVVPMSVLLLTALASSAAADTFGTGANQFDIDFVTISGSAADGYGGQVAGDFATSNINRDYRMGVYEISNAQWEKFVDANGAPTGNPGNAYDQSASWEGDNVPTTGVSWYEAAQFVNWLNTSTGRQAAYKFDGSGNLLTWSTEEAWGETNLYRHAEAFYFLPDEDEWVKAAYWNGTGLQKYATPSGGSPVKNVDSAMEMRGMPDLGTWMTATWNSTARTT